MAAGRKRPNESRSLSKPRHILKTSQLQIVWKLLIGLFAAIANGALEGAEFYVSPTGVDLNPGTRSKPFASLGRARDAVREQKRKKPNQNFTVFLRGGTYELKETVVFSLRDSATV